MSPVAFRRGVLGVGRVLSQGQGLAHAGNSSQGPLRAFRHSHPDLSMRRWLGWGSHGCLCYGNATLPSVVKCFQDEHGICVQESPGRGEGGAGQPGKPLG